MAGAFEKNSSNYSDFLWFWLFEDGIVDNLRHGSNETDGVCGKNHGLFIGQLH